MRTLTTLPHRHNTLTVSQRAELIARTHGRALEQLRSMIAHPRALTRALPTWRPPTKNLPAVGDCPPLVACVQRTRLGEVSREQIRAAGEQRPAAFVVTLRFTDPSGRPVAHEWAQSWVRALLGHASAADVHELLDQPTPTWTWVVSPALEPLRSPASLFVIPQQAA